MKQINESDAALIVKKFLQELINKNAAKDKKNIEKMQQELEKAISDSNEKQVDKLKNKIKEIQTKYDLEVWMNKSANWMSKQIGFGTHISKGIHSSSKGDNINFSPQYFLPDGIIGHQSTENHRLDASGNAAALPLFTLFDYEVENNKKIRDYLIENNASFKTAFSRDKTLSLKYFNVFRKLLLSQPEQPTSSELNKQLLWFHGAENYSCLIPLYPSSLTNIIFEKINYIRYSDDMVTARKNRYSDKKTQDIELISYPEIYNLAVTTIGGSNPQGVSQLMSKQGGRNYLLPSLPPPSIAKNLSQQDEEAYRPSKFAKSIFDGKQLAYECQANIEKVFSVVKDTRNIVDVREQRKDALDAVLHTIFTFADYMRTQLPAGWTRDYELLMYQKLWLDPMRAELKGEEAFLAQRENDAWINDVINDFASWMNVLLKAEFPKYKADFADTEHEEWEDEMEDMKKRYERAGKGVFL